MLARTNFGTIWLSLQRWWWHVSNHKNFRQHKQNIWKNTFSFQQVWNRYHTNVCWKVKFIWQKQKCLFIKQYISVTEISHFPNLLSLFNLQRVQSECHNFRRQNFWFYPTVSCLIFLHALCPKLKGTWYLEIGTQLFIKYSIDPIRTLGSQNRDSNKNL